MLARQRCKKIIPNLVWAGSIVTRARKENRIANDYMMLALIEQIDKFRGLAGKEICSILLFCVNLGLLALYRQS